MVETISKSVGTGIDGFSYKQTLVVRKGDSLIQHLGICLVLMDFTKGVVEHPDARIEPL